MAGMHRLQNLLRHIGRQTTYSSALCCPRDFSSTTPKYSSMASSVPQQGGRPKLTITPERSLSDEMLDIHVTGLQPSQLVTLQAEVYTENGKYKFLSHAQYKANSEGAVQVHRDSSLGGSYEGIEPMGLVWSLKPAAEVAHKYPRLVKFDISKPFLYTFKLLDSEERMLDSAIVERHFLADYVEEIPVTTGEADGVLFLPSKKGSSDPLPLVIDVRGLLTQLVVDRAAILASHGFAVFAFDYFRPRAMKSREQQGQIYMDSQAFLDIIEYAKEHPRLDAERIGMTSSCYGGSMTLNAVTRLQLPVKCIVAAGFVDLISVGVGWKCLDGSLIDPIGPMEKYTKIWIDENEKWWIQFTDQMFRGVDFSEWRDKLSVVENLNCPFLMFAHGDDQHIPSLKITEILKERLEKAGKGHLLDYHLLPATGHFLEVPFQPINTISSLYNPLEIGIGSKYYYTNYGGEDIKQGFKDQVFAWREIVNFFRKHLGVTEMYRKDWIFEH